MPIHDQLHFKYHINVDGDTAAWYRLSFQLVTQTIPLKVESTKIEYFYEDLKPWVHYVPIKSDFSDLKEKIEWLRENDQKAIEISKNGVEFARYHFQS